MFEKEDGSIYCGKNVDGLGMVGCSPNGNVEIVNHVNNIKIIKIITILLKR